MRGTLGLDEPPLAVGIHAGVDMGLSQPAVIRPSDEDEFAAINTGDSVKFRPL